LKGPWGKERGQRQRRGPNTEGGVLKQILERVGRALPVRISGKNSDEDLKKRKKA